MLMELVLVDTADGVPTSSAYCGSGTYVRSMLLSDTEVAYIGPKSRAQRPRKTEISTEVAHVTRNSDTTFTVKRSKDKVTRPLYSPRP